MTDKAPTVFEGVLTTGNSPVTLTVAETQEESIVGLTIVNTGPSRFTVQESVSGSSFGDVATLVSGDSYTIKAPTAERESGKVDEVLLTRGTADSSFKVIASAGFVEYHPNPLLSNDTAVTTSVTLNSTTATTVSVANENRIGFYASNNDNQDILLKFQPASVDNLKIGIPILRKGVVYEMPPEKYRGEISAIAITGTPTIFITEY